MKIGSGMERVDSGVPKRAKNLRPRILFADDDHDVRALYDDYFTSRGFRVDVVGDGRGAWERAITTGCDVIVIDLWMFPHDGLEALHRLKRHPATAHIPVIVCSGARFNRMIERALHGACDGYVAKPCRLSELLAEIRRVLDRRIEHRQPA